MSKPNKKGSKVTESTQNTDVVVSEEQTSPWYYFYTVGCGFCKKVDPIVDELIKDGHDILRLDLADSENQKISVELKKEYNVQCGTPWFINTDTGKGVCGYREKDVLQKWLDGKDIPTPPRPKGPIPKPPFHGASKKEENTWKKEYTKWTKENSHLPKIQTAEEILSRPRPKSQPPMPPQPNSTDAQFEEWGKTWDEWMKENSHLPNLQPASVIIENFKKRAQGQQPGQPGQVTNQIVPQDNAKINNIDARVQALEVKVDKLLNHFGVK